MNRKSIVFTKIREAELLEQPMPVVDADDVLVRMEYTVVSGGTERACLIGAPNTSQSFPMSLGYCGVGHVAEIGSLVTNVKVGDRVLVYHGIHSNYISYIFFTMIFYSKCKSTIC